MVYVYESKIYGVLGFDPFPHVQWSKYRVYIYIYHVLYIIYMGVWPSHHHDWHSNEINEYITNFHVE
jgi:hypothetical protein